MIAIIFGDSGSNSDSRYSNIRLLDSADRNGSLKQIRTSSQFAQRTKGFQIGYYIKFVLTKNKRKVKKLNDVDEKTINL